MEAGSEPEDSQARLGSNNRSKAVKETVTTPKFARQRRIIEKQLADEIDSPELAFVRSKRSADEPEGSKPKRSRTTGPKAVASSIDRAVDFEEDREASKLEIAKLKLEKFPKREAAMKLFGKEARNFIEAEDLISAAKVLKTEDNASFFLLLEGQLKWDWLKEEAAKDL